MTNYFSIYSKPAAEVDKILVTDQNKVLLGWDASWVDG